MAAHAAARLPDAGEAVRSIPGQRLRCLNTRYRFTGVSNLHLQFAEEFLTDVDQVIARAEQQG